MRTRWRARNSPSRSMSGSISTVRLHRSMISMPRAEAPSTRGRNAVFISGAPPVISSVETVGEAASTARTRFTVSSDIVSVRFGDDST